MIDYYIYISKSKADMMLPQVPLNLKAKYAAEAGVHLGIFEVKLKTEVTNEPVEADAHKVKFLTDYISSSQQIGNLQSSKEWIRDRLHVKHLTVQENPDLFLLVGEKYGMYHLLGGSSHHVVGNIRPTNVTIGYSYFPYLADALTKTFSAEYNPAAALFEPPTEGERALIPGIRDHEWADAVYALYNESASPTFQIEFFGRFLAFGQSLHRVRCTATSPLWVRQF
jgi:uncharacterized protein (DUF1330 family)